MPVTESDRLKVLLALRDGAAEGYSLLSKTGLGAEQVTEVLRELQAKNMIFVTGEVSPQRVRDAYISLRPSARDYVEMMIFKST